MKNLKIIYTGKDGIEVTLTRNEYIDVEGEPDSDIVYDLANITLRLLQESGVNGISFYERLRETLRYEIDEWINTSQKKKPEDTI